MPMRVMHSEPCVSKWITADLKIAWSNYSGVDYLKLFASCNVEVLKRVPESLVRRLVRKLIFPRIGPTFGRLTHCIGMPDDPSDCELQFHITQEADAFGKSTQLSVLFIDVVGQAASAPPFA